MQPSNDSLLILPRSRREPDEITPLRRLPRDLLANLGFPARCAVFIKDESKNEGGSSKARVAKQMIGAAIEDGRLIQDMEVVLPSSGSTAIATALETSRRKLRLVVFVPRTTPTRKLAALARFGNVRVVRVDGSSEDARLAADTYCAEQRSSGRAVWLADQYGDREAVYAHALTTAPEILLQTRGRVTHVIAGIGTGSTSTGLALGLCRLGIEVIGAQPATADHILVGLKFLPGVPSGLVPRNARTDLLSGVEYVGDAEALTAMEQLIRHGFLFGPSTGAVAVAAARVAQRTMPHTVFVLIGHDSSSLYT